MKIALLTLERKYDKEARVRQINELVLAAAKDGAVIAFLPELSYCGYSTDKLVIGGSSFTEGVNFFCDLAKKLGIYIGFGVAKPFGDKFKNSYMVASKDGLIVGAYDKIHIFSYGDEHTVFEGGDSLCVCEIDGLKVGICVCYDLRFAELASAYSKKCDAIVYPSAWPKKRKNDFKTLLKARALENRVYAIGVNWGGEEYEKLSLVYDQNAKTVKPFSSGEYIDIIEIQEGSAQKSAPNSKADKLFSLYAKFYSEIK